VKVALIPEPHAWPKSGGVRQHCAMLHRHIWGYAELTPANLANMVHVQSAYPSDKVDVYTCHGGFTPHPIAIVYKNLKAATKIISVAKWIVDEFFLQYTCKTIVIPNGVDLVEWENLPHNIQGLAEGFVLTKGYNSIKEHWLMLIDVARSLSNCMFVSIGAPMQLTSSRLLPNFIVLPVQPHKAIQGLFNDCLMYISPSSEVNPVLAMEAMAACKPVVGLDLHGNQEVLHPDCLYSGIEDLQHLILTASQGQLDDVVDSNKRRVETEYNWQHLIKRTVEVYEDVLTDA